MKHHALAVLLSLSLGACASAGHGAPPTRSAPAVPAEAAPEQRAGEAPVEDWGHLDLAAQRERFIREAAATYRLDPAVLRQALDQARIKEGIIAAMSRPAERVKPGHAYWPTFITQARIDGGRAFLAENRQALEKVQARTGVPA